MKMPVSLKTVVVAVAASPQGRRMVKQGVDWVRRPENREKLKQGRERALSKGAELRSRRGGSPPR